MRFVLLAFVVACTPGGKRDTEELCAKATKMYERCEYDKTKHPQAWELELDRWRGLCRAVFTGETKQLLPDGLQMYEEMSEEIRAGLKQQAECTS